MQTLFIQLQKRYRHMKLNHRIKSFYKSTGFMDIFMDIHKSIYGNL